MKRATWMKLFLAVAVLGMLVLAWRALPADEWARTVLEWVRDSGWIGAILFIVIYLGLSLVGFPRTPLNIAGGVVFPYWLGLVIVLASGSLTHFSTFTIARHFARDSVERRLSKVPNVDRIMTAVENDGFKLVMLIRMNPFVPGVIKGYGFGTTQISIFKYMLGSFLGCLPIAAAHVYFGWIGGEAMMSSEGLPEEWQRTMIIGGVVGSIVMVTALIFISRRALNRRLPA
jgi:uncharacterized membrane protein YdjX (TVP38/TMEM64 family)